MERQFNILINDISDNLHLIDTSIKIGKEAIDRDEPIIDFTLLHEFELHEGMGLNLHNLDLINQLLSFEIEIKRINNSIVAVTKCHSDIKTLYCTPPMRLHS